MARQPIEKASVARIDEIQIDGSGVGEDDGGAIAMRRNDGALVHAGLGGEAGTAIVVDIYRIGGGDTGDPRRIGKCVAIWNPVGRKARFAIGGQLADTGSVRIADIDLAGTAAAADEENFGGCHGGVSGDFPDQRIGERVGGIAELPEIGLLLPLVGARIGEPRCAERDGDSGRGAADHSIERDGGLRLIGGTEITAEGQIVA